MRLIVVSHKLCWPSKTSPTGYVTDGGFPLQMEAISELFTETRVVVPCEKIDKKNDNNLQGTSALKGKNLEIIPLTLPKGTGLRRKLNMLSWFISNANIIWSQVRQADAVHTPIPGDIGTIGMFFALVLKKPLFVRHCGNWFVQRTLAERFWKWSMEYFAGGRNVMLATGGAGEAPSCRNPNIKWIFSTSLRKNEIAKDVQPKLPTHENLRLIITCRQEKRKGTDVVINSLPLILKTFPGATLDVIGGGSLLPELKSLTKTLNLENQITFHGKVEQSKVIKLLKQAHVFCYPTSASEGFPKVVLEALSAGLPVITTRVSVLPQLISSGCGILLDSPSPESLSKATTEVCSDKVKYTQMSAAAISTARQYSLEKWRDSIGETLRRCWKVSSLS